MNFICCEEMLCSFFYALVFIREMIVNMRKVCYNEFENRLGDED